MRSIAGSAQRDRAMLGQYLESVREIERRVQKMQANDLSKLRLPELPVGTPEFDKQLRLMYDMVALAYEANITRVSTFMLDAEVEQSTLTRTLGFRTRFIRSPITPIVRRRWRSW